jgi:O-acetyl-ADP-ribose deacetylase (regulator of RNase III)
MKELKRDLFDCVKEVGVDAICITTNGNTTKNGNACMGGGCAGECAKRWPETVVRLGKCLINFKDDPKPNRPFVIGALDGYGKYIEPNLRIIKQGLYKCLIFSFPTMNSIMDNASLELIESSAKEMVVWANRFGLRNIIVPRPGVGIGGCHWDDVKKIIEPILDDRFTIVSFDSEE